MKRLTSSLIALTFAAALPAAGYAQTPGTSTDRPAPERRATDRSDADRMKKERQSWSNTQGLHETGQIIGTRIKNAQGKDVGEIDALLIDPREGKVSHAVIGIGGLLGIGEEKVVVPYSALQMTGHADGKRAQVTVDQSALDQAPKYVKASDRQPAASPATTRPATEPAMKKDADMPKSDTQKSDAPKTDKKY